MSKRVVVELTNRCNLACGHCFSGRHGGSDDLPLEVLAIVLEGAKSHGFEHVTYTGGDPTVHPDFPGVVKLTHESGLLFSFVTNGWNFTTIFPRIAQYRDRLKIVTFSLDGATEQTHDDLRGNNSYRRVMKAMAYCHGEKLPFTINMSITRQNRHEIPAMTQLAANLGARGVRFGHLMPNFQTTIRHADLTPWERKEVDAEIHGLRRASTISIGMAPGFHTTDLAPCAPLNLQEVNVDVYGNLTKCCHLSSHGEGAGDDDVMGHLPDEPFAEAYARLVSDNERFMREKRAMLARGDMQDTDLFPCWFCSVSYGKVEWLRKIKSGPWASLANGSGRNGSDRLAAEVTTSKQVRWTEAKL